MATGTRTRTQKPPSSESLLPFEKARQQAWARRRFDEAIRRLAEDLAGIGGGDDGEAIGLPPPPPTTQPLPPPPPTTQPLPPPPPTTQPPAVEPPPFAGGGGRPPSERHIPPRLTQEPIGPWQTWPRADAQSPPEFRTLPITPDTPEPVAVTLPIHAPGGVWPAPQPVLLTDGGRPPSEQNPAAARPPVVESGRRPPSETGGPVVASGRYDPTRPGGRYPADPMAIAELEGLLAGGPFGTPARVPADPAVARALELAEWQRAQTAPPGPGNADIYDALPGAGDTLPAVRGGGAPPWEPGYVPPSAEVDPSFPGGDSGSPVAQLPAIPGEPAAAPVSEPGAAAGSGGDSGGGTSPGSADAAPVGGAAPERIEADGLGLWTAEGIASNYRSSLTAATTQILADLDAQIANAAHPTDRAMLEDSRAAVEFQALFMATQIPFIAERQANARNAPLLAAARQQRHELTRDDRRYAHESGLQDDAQEFTLTRDDRRYAHESGLAAAARAHASAEAALDRDHRSTLAAETRAHESGLAAQARAHDWFMLTTGRQLDADAAAAEREYDAAVRAGDRTHELDMLRARADAARREADDARTHDRTMAHIHARLNEEPENPDLSAEAKSARYFQMRNWASSEEARRFYSMMPPEVSGLLVPAEQGYTETGDFKILSEAMMAGVAKAELITDPGARSDALNGIIGYVDGFYAHANADAYGAPPPPPPARAAPEPESGRVFDPGHDPLYGLFGNDRLAADLSAPGQLSRGLLNALTKPETLIGASGRYPNASRDILSGLGSWLHPWDGR